MRKTVNVNVTLQLTIEEGGDLIRVQEGLDFINGVLERESEDYEAHIFVGSVDDDDITEMRDGIPVDENSQYICGSCGEHVDNVTWNEERDIDECDDCKD